MSMATPAFLWKSAISYHSQQAPVLGPTIDEASNAPGKAGFLLHNPQRYVRFGEKLSLRFSHFTVTSKKCTFITTSSPRLTHWDTTTDSPRLATAIPLDS